MARSIALLKVSQGQPEAEIAESHPGIDRSSFAGGADRLSGVAPRICSRVWARYCERTKYFAAPGSAKLKTRARRRVAYHPPDSPAGARRAPACLIGLTGWYRGPRRSRRHFPNGPTPLWWPCRWLPAASTAERDRADWIPWHGQGRKSAASSQRTPRATPESETAHPRRGGPSPDPHPACLPCIRGVDPRQALTRRPTAR